RVELGEIEQQLLQIAAVGNCVLLLREDQVGQQQLVAYVVLTDHKQQTAEQIKSIRDSLAEKLPDYMLPAVFMRIEQVPLTPNGKVDKKALPKPDAADIQGQYTKPQGETEQHLVNIWAQLLKLPAEKISADGNFFELGGHSLLSVKLVSEIRQQFKAEISIRDVFEYPQLSQLGRHISQAAGSQLPPIKPVTRQDNKLTPSFAQQRLWFIDQMDGGSAHYNMPSALRLQGDFKVTVAEQAFTTIIQRHESLRTVFIDGNDGPLQVIKNQFDFTIKTTDLRQLTATKKKQTIAQAIEKDATQAFDLSQDLMLRVSYLKLSDDAGILLFNMHHIASDGWSTGILVNEFVRLYESILTGKENPLSPLPIQYADYAYWQRNWLQGEVLDKQLNYWDGQLAELPQVHSLPLDYERPQYQTFNGGAYAFEVGADTLKGLRKIVRDKNITLFMLMHAAFSLLLARYSNNNDIVIGTVVANRRQKELEPIIGFFINTLVLRADCSGNPTFSDFLTQIKNTNLDAQENQDVPFEHLVERLQPDRSTSHGALFQISLNMNNNETEILSLPGVKLSPADTEQRQQLSTKFELTLGVTEADDGLQLGFQYNKDLFKESSIKRLSHGFKLLLKDIAGNPEKRISDLQVITTSEQHYL
ncbi:MAG TPA: non-ribosomal peptide synthetase, partial [Oceanospirillales bacterium]|nr:non-ribosomal peptide synthetase [Oceanospirillales bacterium]